MSGKRGRWNKEISERERKWENALALIMHQDDLAILLEDCGEVYLRFRQILHRHPERAPLVQPGLERAEIMHKKLLRLRDELERARQLLLEWREENGNGA